MLSFTPLKNKENCAVSRCFQNLVRSILLIVVFLACLLTLSCKDQEYYAMTESSPAPQFSLQDMGGKTVSLSQYKGKAVFLEFWATWCPPCRDSVPELNELNRYLSGKEAVLLSISVDEGPSARENLNEFIAEYGITYPVLIGNEDVEGRYGITNIPVLFLFDKQHRLAKKYVGPVPAEELKKDVEGLL